MSGEKTEKPTPRRLDDQRKEGQIPQRKTVIEAALLTFAILLLTGLSGPLSAAFVNLSGTVFSHIAQDFEAARASALAAAADAVRIGLAICVSIAVFTVFFGLLVNRFLFAQKAVSPKFQRFNPAAQFKTLFSKSTLYNFARLLIYFSIISIIFYFIVKQNLENAVNSGYCGENCLYPFFISRMKIVVMNVLGVLVLLAVADYRIQTRLFLSQNKMTKDEVKREFKGQEGDPEIKAERKSVAMSDAVMPLPSDATHVVHSDQVLVAIIFYPEAGQRPYVVFRAKGARVLGLCRKFRALKIPTVNLPGTALDLYRMASPGQYLPARSARSVEKVLRAARTRS